MKLFKNAFALSGALVSSLFYTISALLITFLPGTATSWFMWYKSAYLLTPFLGTNIVGFLSGLMQVFVGTYVFLWLWAWLNNKIISSYRSVIIRKVSDHLN